MRRIDVTLFVWFPLSAGALLGGFFAEEDATNWASRLQLLDSDLS